MRNYLLAVFLLSFVTVGVSAQQVDDVHITPRMQTPPLAPPIPNVPTLAVRSRPLRVDVSSWCR